MTSTLRIKQGYRDILPERSYLMQAPSADYNVMRSGPKCLISDGRVSRNIS